VEDGAMLS